MKHLLVTYDNSYRTVSSSGQKNDQLHRFQHINDILGVDYVILGEKERWRGFSSKINSYNQFLNGGTGNGSLSNDTYLFIVDSRDVIFNQPWNISMEKLTRQYLLSGKRIMVGTEPCCCKKMMNHGMYQEPGMTPDKCPRGCGHLFKEKMHNISLIAAREGNYSPTPFQYINSGTIFGQVWNMKDLFRDMAFSLESVYYDDQARLTQLFYRQSDRFWLDYRQDFFSNSDRLNSVYWVPTNPIGCFFAWNPASGSFMNTVTRSNPVLIHTSGKHWECYNLIYDKLYANISVPLPS